MAKNTKIGTYVALLTKSSSAEKRTRCEAQRLSTVLSKAKRTQKSEVEVANDEVETNVMGLENYHPLGDQGQLDEATEMQKEVYNLQTISVNGRASILPTRIRTIHHTFRQVVLALVLQSFLQSEAQYNRTASPAQIPIRRHITLKCHTSQSQPLLLVYRGLRQGNINQILTVTSSHVSVY
jgi:hypothetical protein